MLSDRYRVVAPDLPGFGFSEAPDRAQFNYTFDHLTQVIDRFTETVGLRRYALYVFDYGAPIGFRLALAHPERVTAIISQNGNAYEEGLSQGWNPIQKYWKEPTETNRAALRDFLKPETTRFQYVHGVSDETLVAPESYALDSALLGRPGNPATTRYSSTCSSITLPMSGSIQSSRNISEPSSRRYWRSGVRTIRSFWRPEQRRSNGTTRKPKCTFTTPATSRWRLTFTRSRRPFATFSVVTSRSAAPD
jgi:alpha/beta hydrolase fold